MSQMLHWSPTQGGNRKLILSKMLISSAFTLSHDPQSGHLLKEFGNIVYAIRSFNSIVILSSLGL